MNAFVRFVFQERRTYLFFVLAFGRDVRADLTRVVQPDAVEHERGVVVVRKYIRLTR